MQQFNNMIHPAQRTPITDFIKFALEPDSELPSSIANLDWNALHRFAEEQTILGVVFEGINRLQATSAKPDVQLLMRWFMENETINQNNRLLNKRIAEITAIFGEHGFRTCLLKGQGNMRMYPQPFSRMPGDIDLWVDGKREEVEKLCRQLNPQTIISYHHAQQSFKDVMLEVHFTPNYAGNYIYNKRLQAYFESRKDAQMNHIVTLPDSDVVTAIPTADFNIIFQLSHLMKHFLYEGVGLRQVVDYYYLLKHSHKDHTNTNYPEQLKHLNLYRFATALMWVLHDFLGLEKKYLIVEPNEKEGRMLLEAILIGGNFGIHDSRYNTPGKGRLAIFANYMRRSMQFATHYPQEVLLGRPFLPIWRRLLR